MEWLSGNTNPDRKGELSAVQKLMGSHEKHTDDDIMGAPLHLETLASFLVTHLFCLVVHGR